MKIISPENQTGYVATIGFFDGVHLGHQFVIGQLKSIARKQSLPGLVITFEEHPRKVLQPEFSPVLLTTLPEKLILLDKNGADACAILKFTPEMSRMPAFDFMKQVLRQQYKVQTLLIGYDHHFGHNRSETFADYANYGKQLGMDVVQLNGFSNGKTNRISSSEIRYALLNGNIERANQMLGYEYFFEGKVVNGFKVGRKIGFPTANLQSGNAEKLLPSSGVYAVQAILEGSVYPGMLNIGKRPTLANGDQTSVEVHIIGFSQEIYEQVVKIEFIRKIRDERKFANVDELITQLKKDKESVQNMRLP